MENKLVLKDMIDYCISYMNKKLIRIHTSNVSQTKAAKWLDTGIISTFDLKYNDIRVFGNHAIIHLYPDLTADGKPYIDIEIKDLPTL